MHVDGVWARVDECMDGMWVHVDGVWVCVVCGCRGQGFEVRPSRFSSGLSPFLAG